MKNIATLTQRELTSYLFSPMGYLIVFLFLLGTGMSFSFYTLVPGEESRIDTFFVEMAKIFVLCIPILTMRLLSEEFATGTIETLMTAPITDVELVVSKFLSVFLFYCLLLATTLVHIAFMAYFGKLDVGNTVVAYIGMLLLGALYSAVGVFASSLTRYQLVAAVVGVAILALLTFATLQITKQWPSTERWLVYVNVLKQFSDFSRGILDSTGLIYFLSGTFFFLFLAVKIVESKRWR